MTLFDDDAAAARRHDPEQEKLVLLVRPVDEGFLVVGTSREDADEALTVLRNQLLIAGPLALVVAGGLGYLVAGAGLRPIERMRARAATISARTDGERLPVPAADDELRRLALTLNATIARLEEGLQRERRFVAEASHDLRTSLALMLTEVEFALAQPRPPEELTRALHSIHDEVHRLIALAETSSNALGRETGPADRDPSRRPRGPGIAGRGALRAGRLPPFHPAHRTTPRPDPGRRHRLDRALSNLIDNALRHWPGDIDVARATASRRNRRPLPTPAWD